MHDFPPNINWRYTTLLATLLGYVACGDFTVREQVAFGNWILQIGQTVITNATYQELIEARIMGEENINLNSDTFKRGGSPFIKTNPPPPEFSSFYNAFKSQISEEELSNLQSAIQRIYDELEKIKRES